MGKVVTSQNSIPPNSPDQDRGGRSPSCLDAVDTNGDGGHDLSDAIFVLDYLFTGVEARLEDPLFDCGPDPTEDSLWCIRHRHCGNPIVR